MKRKIFKYELTDSWGSTISEVNVANDDEETEISCFYFDINSGTERGFALNTDSFRVIIDASATEKINQIVMLGFFVKENPAKRIEY